MIHHPCSKNSRSPDIKVGNRHRKDMGDLTSLADSIRQEGLLQPIGVTDKLELVFGERRIRATRDILKKKTILARIVDVTSIIAGEYAENEVRKDFTPSERVAIAKAIERQVGNRQGQRTDKQRVQKIAQVDPGKRTRETAAEKAGFGNHETYRQAAKVVENGTPKLIQAMDEGRVSISAASILADADADEQEAVLELDEKAILQAAKEIRARQAEKRAEHQDSKTLKPQTRPKKERLKATRLIHGDCRRELKKLPDKSVDLILTDPPYPEIDREYGRMTEAEWHDLMKTVVTEGRRVLKPTGSMVVILQPNFEKVGKMRLWLWEFVAWAGREWNLVQDAYWWSYDAMPLSGTNRKQWADAAIGQDVRVAGPGELLSQPGERPLAAVRRQLRRKQVGFGPATHAFRPDTIERARIADTVEERGGTTPFNLMPVAAGGIGYAGHQATRRRRPTTWPHGG